jgi:hypothetical protein
MSGARNANGRTLLTSPLSIPAPAAISDADFAAPVESCLSHLWAWEIASTRVLSRNAGRTSSLARKHSHIGRLGGSVSVRKDEMPANAAAMVQMNRL